jgi:hypothetical protein
MYQWIATISWAGDLVWKRVSSQDTPEDSKGGGSLLRKCPIDSENRVYVFVACLSAA